MSQSTHNSSHPSHDVTPRNDVTPQVPYSPRGVALSPHRSLCARSLSAPGPAAGGGRPRQAAEPSAEMSLAEGRAPRRTAGNRLSGLLQAEEEDEFYQTTYGGFNEASGTGRERRGTGRTRRGRARSSEGEGGEWRENVRGERGEREVGGPEWGCPGNAGISRDDDLGDPRDPSGDPSLWDSGITGPVGTPQKGLWGGRSQIPQESRNNED